jgi:hypothetical protein
MIAFPWGGTMRGFSYLDDQTWLQRNILRRGFDRELPISKTQARSVTKWMKQNWADKIQQATANTPFPPHIICAITCQETAYFWVSLLDKLTPGDVLGRCVLDASGEMASDPRSVFPKNTAEFRQRFGDEFAGMLIEEANKTRQLRNYAPKQWVYKGYGLFQYDLQYVVDDEAFFRDRQWYGIDACAARVMKELNEKYSHTHDLWKAVKAYNGSGSRAEQYVQNVRDFASVTEEEWASAPAGGSLPPTS